MPERFTELFARRLDSLCRPTIKEARDGELILPGTVYVAPGNFHMALANQGANRIIKIGTGPRLFNQRPAVDVLFNAVAANIGRNALGILLTGMGRDGAQGLLRMKNQGSSTIAQDEASCIVFGMPKEAIALGAAGEILSLDKIPAALLAWSKKVKTA